MAVPDDVVMTQYVANGFAGSAAVATRPNAVAEGRDRGVPVIDVVFPEYNEQAAPAGSIRRLHRYLADTLPFTARITIADNASIDETPGIAAELADELDGVRVVRLEQKGRGRALHAACCMPPPEPRPQI